MVLLCPLTAGAPLSQRRHAESGSRSTRSTIFCSLWAFRSSCSARGPRVVVPRLPCTARHYVQATDRAGKAGSRPQPIAVSRVGPWAAAGDGRLLVASTPEERLHCALPYLRLLRALRRLFTLRGRPFLGRARLSQGLGQPFHGGEVSPGRPAACRGIGRGGEPRGRRWARRGGNGQRSASRPPARRQRRGGHRVGVHRAQGRWLRVLGAAAGPRGEEGRDARLLLVRLALLGRRVAGESEATPCVALRPQDVVGKSAQGESGNLANARSEASSLHGMDTPAESWRRRHTPMWSLYRGGVYTIPVCGARNWLSAAPWLVWAMPPPSNGTGCHRPLAVHASSEACSESGFWPGRWERHRG